MTVHHSQTGRRKGIPISRREEERRALRRRLLPLLTSYRPGTHRRTT